LLRAARTIASRAIVIRAASARRRHRIGTTRKARGNTSKNYQYADEGAPEKACSINDLNKDPMMVNVANGTLNSPSNSRSARLSNGGKRRAALASEPARVTIVRRLISKLMR